MSLRFDFVELAQAEGANVALVCRRFGISRKTGYKWLTRYKAAGREALGNQSRRPKSSPKRTSQALEAQIVELRRRHRAWGGRKLRTRLENLGVRDLPAASTITEILRRHDLLDAKKCQDNQTKVRFEHPRPNDLWQMDFKGHFGLASGARCHPLTALDDHSRYALILQACADQLGATVRLHLIEAFRRYGLPRRMLMDNGGPWGSAGEEDYWTKFEVWLMRLGIQVMHGRAMHPQTQGKEERFHGTLVAEVLRWQVFHDFDHVQKHLNDWKRIYNHERPHEGIGMKVPVSRYTPSAMNYPESLPQVEYPAGDVVKRVRHNRCIKIGSVDYRIGRAFAGEHIALRPTREDGLLDVYYCQQRIGQIDQKDPAGRTLRAARPLAPLASDPPGA
jgi:transposase InsO family protein